MEAERIVLDPGIGFGKTVEQNFSLLARQAELLAAGSTRCWRAGRASRRWARSPGAATRGHRVAASVAAALLAVERGARVVRVHDVRETVEALAVWQAAQAAG